MVISNIDTTKLSRIKGLFRIGPHNKDILCIIYGSLLGDGHAEKKSLGVGTRISFFQEASHVEYIFYLHDLLSKSGYCNISKPEIKTRIGVGGKLRKIVRFST
jgi:ubiquinol-cytochrome c reductase cytochrome b subunit